MAWNRSSYTLWIEYRKKNSRSQEQRERRPWRYWSYWLGFCSSCREIEDLFSWGCGNPSSREDFEQVFLSEWVRELLREKTRCFIWCLWNRIKACYLYLFSEAMPKIIGSEHYWRLGAEVLKFEFFPELIFFFIQWSLALNSRLVTCILPENASYIS